MADSLNRDCPFLINVRNPSRSDKVPQKEQKNPMALDRENE